MRVSLTFSFDLTTRQLLLLILVLGFFATSFVQCHLAKSTQERDRRHNEFSSCTDRQLALDYMAKDVYGQWSITLTLSLLCPTFTFVNERRATLLYLRPEEDYGVVVTLLSDSQFRAPPHSSHTHTLNDIILQQSQ